MMIDRTSFYAEIRRQALAKRAEYSVRTEIFGVREVRRIYSHEGVAIDIRSLPPALKAIYVCIEGEASVAIRKGLPGAPKLFALVHELKHHWLDQQLIQSGNLTCGDYNMSELTEKSAEVFAAEFIYPMDEFAEDIGACSVGRWQIDDIIRFKRERCRAKVSYMFIQKRMIRMKLVELSQLEGVKFQRREEEIYGPPVYKQAWFQARRRAARGPR